MVSNARTWKFVIAMFTCVWSVNRADGQAVAQNTDALETSRVYDFQLRAEDAVPLTHLAAYNAPFVLLGDDSGPALGAMISYIYSF